MATLVAEGKPDTLMTRLVSAAVMAPVALGLVWLGGWYFAGLIIVVGVLMVVEWDRLCGGSGVGAHIWLLRASVIATSVLVTTQQWNVVLPVALGGIVLAVISCRADRPLWTALGGTYILLPLIALLWIRLDPNWGLLTIVWIMLAVWATDAGAYFAGKGIGGPKMAPRLSPNKTWAGLGGGVIAAALISVTIGRIAGEGEDINLALFGGLVAVVGQIGDICESGVKRRFGVKDSGTIIPGHGGLFDRLDSLLFVAVIIAGLTFLTGKAVPWQ